MNRARRLVLAFFIAAFLSPLLAAADQNLKNRAAIVASYAYAWLAGQKNETEFEPDVVWIYDYLMRKFALPELPQVARFRADALGGRFDTAGFSPLLHVLSPGAGRAPDLQSESLHHIDRSTFGALWCDRIELPEDYGEKIAALATHGEYALTHVYLALQILKEKQCAYYTAHRVHLGALETQLKAEMAALPQKTGKTGDLEIETAAFYAFANSGVSPSENFLRRAVEFGEQRLTNKYVVRLRGHTVVLLLWFLLEHLVPGAPTTAISRPVN